jgi:hypothetical protein
VLPLSASPTQLHDSTTSAGMFRCRCMQLLHDVQGIAKAHFSIHEIALALSASLTQFYDSTTCRYSAFMQMWRCCGARGPQGLTEVFGRRCTCICVRHSCGCSTVVEQRERSAQEPTQSMYVCTICIDVCTDVCMYVVLRYMYVPVCVSMYAFACVSHLKNHVFFWLHS